jgi:hypothetical protein
MVARRHGDLRAGRRETLAHRRRSRTGHRRSGRRRGPTSPDRGDRWRSSKPRRPFSTIHRLAPSSRRARRSDAASLRHNALNHLEEKDREIVILRGIEQVANKDVAAIVGIPADTGLGALPACPREAEATVSGHVLRGPRGRIVAGSPCGRSAVARAQRTLARQTRRARTKLDQVTRTGSVRTFER